MPTDGSSNRLWLWIGLAALLAVPPSCCCLWWASVVLTAPSSSSVPVPVPTPSTTQREPSYQPSPPAVEDTGPWVPCPTFQRSPRNAPELLPTWVPAPMHALLRRPFAAVPVLVEGQPSMLDVVRDDRNRPVALRISGLDGSGDEIPLPAPARRALSRQYRAADVAVMDEGRLGVAIQAESTVVVAVTDRNRRRVRQTVQLPLPRRNRARPGRPRVASGDGVLGVVVPIGRELAWYEVTSRARVSRGPVLLNIHSDRPRLVWNGSRFVILGSPEGEGDHTLEFYEVDPGGGEASERRTIVREHNPGHPFEQRRHDVRGDLVFEQGAYFMLVASWSASSRNPDRRLELFRIGIDQILARRTCPDPWHER